jgi:hypothetical protein
MAQSIALATKFQPILDEIYKAASLTARMDTPVKPVNFAGANVVSVFKTTPIGLGTYSRVSGYPAGQVVGTWETLTLASERGRAFVIDRMDDEETLGMAFGTLAGEFIRTQVAPELDAYRFSKYASTSSINAATPATLDANTIIPALDAAKLALDEDEVPSEGRILYISDACLSLLEGKVSRFLSNENNVDKRVMRYSGMDVVMVPQTRFYKGVTLNDGATVNAGGYAKTDSTGKDINFMIIHPSAVVQVVKHDALKVFTPEENQTTDGWLVQYRIYHDAFVLANKLNGVYAHWKA